MDKEAPPVGVIRKVPGQVLPVGKLNHEKNCFKLREKSLLELKDALLREQRLLKNTKLISQLADKGKKIKDRISEIEAEIKLRNAPVDETADLMGGLKIDVNSLEWNNDSNINNVFQILASKELPLNNEEFDSHIRELSSKIDAKSVKGRFVPFGGAKTKTSDDQIIPLTRTPTNKEKKKPQDLMPLPQDTNNKVQLISLSESLNIQLEQAEKLKDIRIQHATERLAQQQQNSSSGFEDDDVNIKDEMAYRDNKHSDVDDEEEEEEHDYAVEE